MSKRRLPLKHIEQLELAKDHLERLINPGEGGKDGNGIRLTSFHQAKKFMNEREARESMRLYIESWVLWRLDEVIDYAKNETKGD